MAVITLALLAAVLLGATGAPVENQPRAAGISLPPGFSRILFQDDFSTQAAGSQPSSSRWIIDTGTGYPGGPARWGTNEVETYTSSLDNLAITSAGTLLITPLRRSDGRWTSGRIEARPEFDFSCPAGGRVRVEASIRLGAASRTAQMGIWPSFWMLGSAFRGRYNNWPSVGELDVLESINGAAATWQTVHCGPGGDGGPCNEYTGLTTVVDLSRGQFHTASVDIDRTNAGGGWAAERIVWRIDGRETSSLTGARVGDEAAWNALARAPKFLLLNIAVGGDFPDNAANDGHVKTPTSQTEGGSGSAMEVKYIAVYST